MCLGRKVPLGTQHHHQPRNSSGITSCINSSASNCQPSGCHKWRNNRLYASPTSAILAAMPLLTPGCKNQRRAADSRDVSSHVSTVATSVLVSTVK
ncbi:hypothetical protein D3C73_1474650 [compost metagenome]